MNDDGHHVPDSSAVLPTSAVTFQETEHGRLRRRQRGIDKKDLQAAKKYGTKVRNYWQPNETSKYLYKGITYITENATGREITSYVDPLTLDDVPISDAMRQEHDAAVARLQSDHQAWLSNTVLVVDTSGSMKQADVWGVRSRLHGAWVAVALDFLAHRLETGAACCMDVVSIVTLSDPSRVIVREQPSSWILYNHLLHIYRNNVFPAGGHGPYLPSIDTSEELLQRNPNASCALALLLLSDGKPSDPSLSKGNSRAWNQTIVDRVGALAKQFGRRLNFMAIGLGDMDDFDLLQDMVEAAADYGAIATFKLPSMNSAAIGDAFTSLAKSLTTTQDEMTCVHTLRQLKVKIRIRESKKKAAQAITTVSDDDFWIYPLDRVERSVFHDNGTFQRAPFQHPDTQFVAFGKEPFGEGAERFAYRFFEVAADRKTILGRPLVAKENRLIVEEREDDERARKKFVQTFCKTQQYARRLAEEFNEKLDEIPKVDVDTPYVQFLDCSIYETDDTTLGKLSVLVEERLDQSIWQKWNTNNGYVEGMKSAPTYDTGRIRSAFTRLAAEDLGVIHEGSEDEEGEESDDVDGDGRVRPVVFTPFEVAQAFSHFTYWATGRKRLVCDLQGIYDEAQNRLIFSDPVIHYHNPGDQDRRFVHGRTDRGRKGVAMFFDTHKCTDLCRLVTKGFKAGSKHRGRRVHGHSDKKQRFN